MASADLTAEIFVHDLLKKFADKRLPLKSKAFELPTFLQKHGIPTAEIHPESGIKYDKFHRLLNRLFHNGWAWKWVSPTGYCHWWPLDVPPEDRDPGARKRRRPRTAPADTSAKRASGSS